MIQRVQTLYLLIAAIFTGILLFMPMASFCGVVLAGDLTAWQMWSKTKSEAKRS
mgnify:CR=1 FL=1